MVFSSWLTSMQRKLTNQSGKRRHRSSTLTPVAANCRTERLQPRVLLSAVLTGAGNINVVENDPAAAVNGGLVLTDSDSTTQASATIAVTNFVNGQDVIGFTNDGATMGNIAVASNLNGVLQLTSAGATATNAEWQAALRAVTYTNTSDTPSVVPRVVLVTTDDGSGVSNLLIGTISVTAVDDAPAVTIGGTINFTENGAALAIDTGLTISDVDSLTQNTATITITNYVAGQDTLGFTNDGSTMGNIAVASNVNGVLTLTSAGGTATNAQWEAALHAVTYVNSSDNPDTTPRNVTITVQGTGNASAPLSSTINLTAVDDAALLTVGSNITFTENGTATAVNPGLVLADLDSTTQASATITLTNYLAGQDVLGFINDGATMGNIAIASNVGGVLTLTSAGASATNAEWQAALRAVTYVNTSDAPGVIPRVVTITTNDGVNVSNTLVNTINVSAVNDAAVLSVGGNINFTENGLAAAIDTGLTLADVDSATQASATVTLTNYIAGQDVLAFTNDGATMGNIAVASNINGVLTLTSAGATATNAEWQAALRAVTYLNTSDTPDTTIRNVSIAVNDGTSVSNLLSSTISVTATNDAPVLTVGGNITFTENGPAAAIDTGLTVADVDSTTQANAVITLTNYVSGQDVLGFTNDGSTMGNIAVASNLGGILTLTSAGGTATNAQWQAALRAVTYANTSDNPDTTPRNVTITLDDGTNISSALSSTITVVALPDAPVLAVGGNINFTENGLAAAIDTGITLTDASSPTQQSATITLTNYVAGQDVLGFVNNGATMGNIAVASNVNGVLTLTSAGGTATNAQWQAALRAVTYLNTSDTPDTTTRNVSITVNNGTSDSNSLSSSIAVTASADAPVLTVGGNITFTENGTAAAIDTGLIVADVDSTTQANATVTLTNYVAGQDVLGFVNNGATMGNIAVASNLGGILTLTSAGGTATNAQWQAALRAVTYLNTSDNPDTTIRNVSITLDDGVNISSALSSTITVVATPDAPVLAVGGNINFTENGLAAAIDTGITLSDSGSPTQQSATITLTNYVAGQDVLGFVNNGATMGNIAVASNLGGILTLTSAGGTATNAQWQAALRAVTYLNTSDTPDPTARNVTITVNDGTSVSNTLSSTINVTAVDDAPVLTVGGNVAFSVGGLPVGIDTGLNVADIDSTTQTTAVVTLTNFVAGQDVLSFTNNGTTMGNIAVASNVNGVLTLTSAGGTATNAQWQAALQAVTYANTSASPITTPRDVTITLQGTGDASAALHSTVTLSVGVSAPVLAVGGNINFTENGLAAAIDTGLTVADADSTTQASATVTLTNYVAGQDALAFVNNGATMGNIAVASNVNGVLTLTSAGATATNAQWQAALRAVTYVNTSDNPDTTARNVTITINDGTNVSNSLASTISVAAVDDAPVLAVGGNVSFLVGGLPIGIDTGLTVSDVDSTTQATAVVTLTNFVSGQDVLSFTNNAATMGNIAVASNINGVLTLTSAGGTATNAQWQAALRAVTYANTSASPITTPRDVTITLQGSGAASAALHSTVSISASVIHPVLSGIESIPLPYPPLSDAVQVTSNLQISGNTVLTGATVKISGNFHAGDQLQFTNTASITGSYNAATGTLTLTGSGTVTDYQAALRSITYVSTSTDVSARTISFQVHDATTASLAVTRKVGGEVQLAGSIVVVYGGTGNDTINVSEGANLVVTRNGTNFTFAASQVTGLEIHGGNGSDTVRVNSLNAGTALSIFGEAGNDTLVVGASVTANAILDGGSGNDTLNGGGGREILIGGTGADLILGGHSDALAITGSSIFEGNLSALNLLMSEWSSSASYQDRINGLLGVSVGLNGDVTLNPLTVSDDGVRDIVYGGVGQDAFLGAGNDLVFKSVDELFTRIDLWV